MLIGYRVKRLGITLMKPKAVIFDIGGVLAPDVWETILLHPKTGLAKKYRIDHSLAERTGRLLWNRFGLIKASSKHDVNSIEIEYWQTLRSQLNIKETVDELILLADRAIYAYPGMKNILKDVFRSGAQIIICSNNTTFWFEKQSKALSLSEYVSEEHMIISWRVGCFKSASGGLMFKKVINTLNVEKSESLFFDDRDDNVRLATKMGIPSVVFPSDPKLGEFFTRYHLRQLLKE